MAKIFCLFILLSSCASKFILPSNRIMSPETQGLLFNGQLELSQPSTNQLIINTSRGSVEEGVLYYEYVPSGFHLTTGFTERIDFVWSHVGTGNSLVGGKFQLLGEPKLAKAAGHKAAIVFLTGANSYETGDSTIEFDLSGREFMFLYGFRLNEFLFPYVNLSYANYKFEGVLNTRDSLNGLRPNISSRLITFIGGAELNYDKIILRFEGGAQKISSDKTKDFLKYFFGYSLGYSW